MTVNLLSCSPSRKCLLPAGKMHKLRLVCERWSALTHLSVSLSLSSISLVLASVCTICPERPQHSTLVLDNCFWAPKGEDYTSEIVSDLFLGAVILKQFSKAILYRNSGD